MTLHLNTRCLDILSLLVASEQPVAAADIATRLNISARMVRTSLASQRQWLQDRNITLMQVPSKGFSLVGSAESKRNLAETIRKYDQPLLWLSRSERLYVALLTLFFAPKPIQIKQLQETLNLSRATTIKVMNAAEQWLQEYQLQLMRRQNYGCAIEGEEHDWREGVINLLQESAGDARLLALVQGMKTVVDVSRRTNAGLEEALGKVWIQIDTALIRNAISPIEHEFIGTSSDYAYTTLFICLAIVIYRIRIGKGIRTFPQLSDLSLPAERLSGMHKIAARLEKKYGIHLPEAEIAWIARRIPDPDRLPAVSSRSSTKIKGEGDPAIQEYIDQIVIQASLSLHPSLSTDPDLIRNLTIRVEDLLEPRQLGQTPRNPLLREVKSQFPYIYSVASQSSLILADRLGRELNEDEIGDVAICLVAAMERLRQLDRPTRKVLVVCSEGAVTAWLLVSRLRAEFPDVEVAEVISALDLKNRKHLDGIDFIVSTVPLRIGKIPTRQVNPLLGLEDCKSLKELFEKKENATPKDELVHPSPPHLSDLITPEMIELGVAAENWQEVVEKAGSRLLEAGVIEDRFIQAMKEIILKHGPYMVIWPGAVLLHAPPHGVRELCMGLISLRKPVRFGHPANDPVRIAIVLGAKDNHSHISALLELNRMMQDERARSAIQETVNKSVVLHWVSRYSRIV